MEGAHVVENMSEARTADTSGEEGLVAAFPDIMPTFSPAIVHCFLSVAQVDRIDGEFGVGAQFELGGRRPSCPNTTSQVASRGMQGLRRRPITPIY